MALRTSLESLPPDQRTFDQYDRVIATYKKIPTMTSDPELGSAALMASAELYADMGRLFDPKYFDLSLESYNLVLDKHPTSRYAASALLAIGSIQEQDLKQIDKAEVTYRSVEKKYPFSAKAKEADQGVNRIERNRQAQREVQQDAARELAGRQSVQTDTEKDSRQTGRHATNQVEADAGLSGRDTYSVKNTHAQSTEPVNPHEGGKAAGMSRVTGVHPWNGENYTRIIVDLEDTVHFSAGRLPNPNRLFFDIDQAKIDPKVGTKTLNVQTSIVKTIRFAQYKAGVVRLVLDLDSDKDYSAFLIQNPYRLVIDVHGQPQSERAAVLRQGPALPRPKAMLADDQPASRGSATASAIAAMTHPRSSNNGSYEKTKPAGTTFDGANDDASEPDQPAPRRPAPEPVERLPMRQTSSSHGIRALVPAPEPKPTRDGQTSLTRALGLKISRIVIDPGHGGHDTGTIGPHGLMEKDLCLDVAIRLGKLIQEKLPSAEVIFTRKDDTFIPLEERTAIANQVKADLFISIHANSSHDADARGVETYYLNFATSQESMDVAARENALSQSGMHDLQDIIKKIARNDKMEESKELAGDIQDSLSHRMQQINHTEKDRGVKKAPFVVLIGADMPSVLSEISFLSNPSDEKLLKKPDQRQRVADGIYRGVSSYLENLNSLSYNQQKPLLGPRTQLASTGNPK